jgi:fatty-acyl-CoA synthase
MAALKQSYVHGASEVPLIGETIGQFFDAVCDKHAARPALVVRHQKVRLTYGQLRREVDRLAAGLLTLGFEPGDRIGIWSPNNSEWVLTQLPPPGRADPGQHQSVLSRDRAGIRSTRSDARR